MSRNTAGSGGRAGVWLAAATAALSATLALAAPDAARERELAELLRHDCGSCHGMSLGGGLGPALTPRALAGRSREALREAILHGRAGTAMPPWQELLSDTDVDWLVDALQRGAAGAR